MQPVITLDGITFNPPAADGTGFLLDDAGFVGWYDGTDTRATYAKRPYGDGSYYGPAYHNERVISLTGTFVAANRLGLITTQRQLAALCSSDPNALYPLQVTDEFGSLLAMVQRSVKPLWKPLDDSAAAFSVAVTAPDPRLLAAQPTSVSTPMAQPGSGGVPWNGPSPGSTGTQWNGPAGTTGISWGQPTGTGVIVLDNTAGTAAADITFTITGPVQNPTIFTDTQRIAYLGNLGSSDVLTISTGSGGVLLNGVNRRPYLTSAQFFQIPAGQTLDVRFAADVQNSLAFMTASWRVSYA